MKKYFFCTFIFLLVYFTIKIFKLKQFLLILYLPFNFSLIVSWYTANNTLDVFLSFPHLSLHPRVGLNEDYRSWNLVQLRYIILQKTVYQITETTSQVFECSFSRKAARPYWKKTKHWRGTVSLIWHCAILSYVCLVNIK